MIEGLETKSLEQIFDEMIEAYTQGDYLEGCTSYGEDALMSPKTFAKRFHNVCLGIGDNTCQRRDRGLVPRASTSSRK
jgi:hypothetical protein